MLEKRRLPEAILHLERAVALSPANTGARYLLLDAYALSHQVEPLKALAEATLALMPGDAKARQYLNDRGEVVPPSQPPVRSATAEELLNESLQRYQARDFQGSIDAASKALALRSDYAEAYNNIAASYASLGRWDDAIQAAHEALRLKPDYPLARNNLAWAESEKRKTSLGLN